MFKIAIVEDEQKWIDTISDYIRDYFEETDKKYALDVFYDGIDFISDYKGGYDLVLMDIAMKHLDGLETAKRWREIDKDTKLVFITTIANYAIKGYEVNAFDFLVKPVSYDLFKLKMDKIYSLYLAESNKTVYVETVAMVQKVNLSDIIYIESIKHYVYYHLKDDILKSRQRLSDVMDYFISNDFVEINRSLLVNLEHIDGYKENEVIVGDVSLPLSRVYKKNFLDVLTKYIGRSI